MQNSDFKSSNKIWTYRPPADVERIVNRAIGSKALNPKAARGMRTKLMTEALRSYYAKFAGKKDMVSQ